MDGDGISDTGPITGRENDGVAEEDVDGRRVTDGGPVTGTEAMAVIDSIADIEAEAVGSDDAVGSADPACDEVAEGAGGADS